MCKAGHNRFMTVFVYLNDCAEGGCTTFPRIGLHYGKDGTSFYDNPAPFNITGLEFVSQFAVSVCAPTLLLSKVTEYPISYFLSHVTSLALRLSLSFAVDKDGNKMKAIKGTDKMDCSLYCEPPLRIAPRRGLAVIHFSSLTPEVQSWPAHASL